MGKSLKRNPKKPTGRGLAGSKPAYIELTLRQWRSIIELFILGFGVRKIAFFTGLNLNIILAVLNLTRGVMRANQSRADFC